MYAGPTSRWPFRLGFAALACAWFAVVAYLGADGFFHHAPAILGLAPVQQAIVFPIAASILVFFFVRPVARFIRSADLTTLVAIQGVRILALSHLVSWGYGLMAGGFAFPVAVGNLIVCLLALSFVASVSRRQGRWARKVLVLSVVGMLEFLMTIALAVLGYFTAPLPFDPPVAAGGYVSFGSPPLSLFPTYAIPVLTIVHIATLIALRHQTRPSVLAEPPCRRDAVRGPGRGVFGCLPRPGSTL